jgi:hypothetical protein
MGRIKELFTEYQQQMTGSNADLIDDEYHFQKWVESLPSVSNPSHITHSVFSDNDGWTEEMEARYWAEQPPYTFETDEDIERMNDSIKPKYSDWDITSVLHEVLGDANPDTDDILIRLNNLYNIKNGYID